MSVEKSGEFIVRFSLEICVLKDIRADLEYENDTR